MCPVAGIGNVCCYDLVALCVVGLWVVRNRRGLVRMRKQPCMRGMEIQTHGVA